MPWDDDLDALSVMVPVDLLGTAGAVVSIKANGVELAEDSTAAWNSATTYNVIGTRVHSPSTHWVYENLKSDSSNVNKDPTVAANRTTAAGVGTYWVEVGPTNRAAMFDGLTSTQTAAATPLEITLAPGALNGLALFGIDADTMSIEVTNGAGGPVIYSETGTVLEGSMPADYYEYFFERFKPLTQLVRTGIEPYAAARVKVTLTKASGTVKLGMLAVGDMRPLGIPQRDLSIEPTDFSYFKQDAWGNATTRKGGNATNLVGSAVLEIEDAGAVLDTIQEVMGIPVVVVGSEAQFYEWLTVFGLISAKLVPVPYPDATINISVKGLM
jgi:hypothetical protein